MHPSLSIFLPTSIPHFSSSHVPHIFVSHLTFLPSAFNPHAHSLSSHIPINLISHNNHPQQKNTPNQLKRPRRRPALTDTILLQIRELIFICRRYTGQHLAVVVDAPRSPELHGDDDEPDHPEHKEDEGAHYYYAWEKLPLGYQPGRGSLALSRFDSGKR
jgi:hypothetical protein